MNLSTGEIQFNDSAVGATTDYVTFSSAVEGEFLATQSSSGGFQIGHFVLVDTTSPSLSIQSPIAGAQLTNALLTVQGTATDDVQVAGVAYQLNTNGWAAANGSTNWTAANLVLMPGTNNFSAYSVDTSGNVSTTSTLNFVYLASAVLTVTTNGNGTVSPNDNGALLQLGKSYSITATAGMGFAFTNWTGGTNLPLSVITNGVTVQFSMVPNLMLQANFVDVTKPTIGITSPTIASTYNTFSNNINLGGTASDNVGVTQVTWNNSGGGSGTASGTVNWSITGVALQSGTNLITVTAHDATGNSGNAALTVTYNLPTLGIARQNSNIILTWPTNAVGFILENATNLPAASWTTNSTSPSIVNGQNTVTNAISNATKFYRLINP
jgi:hypothetical protein